MRRRTDHTAPGALWSGLIDDAAVFPPGNAPLDQAVLRHREHLRADYGSLIGPLLVPAGSVAELVRLAATTGGAAEGPLRVALISRPGSDPAVLLSALDQADAHPAVEVTGAEVGWYDTWLQDLAGRGEIAVEVPRGEQQERAIREVAIAYRDGHRVLAKLRTGPTPTWPWPAEAELAAFLDHAAAETIPVKLTGGLHHAVRGAYLPVGGADQDREENHGLLNILVALAQRVQDLARAEEMAVILTDRNAAGLAETVALLDETTVHAVRSLLTSFGCCTVTDPIGELADLGLVTAPGSTTTTTPTTLRRTDP